MKVVVIANLRWIAYCPSWFRLAREGTPVDLIFNGDKWYLTNGETSVAVPDRDTGAMLLAKALNRQAIEGEQGA